MLNERKLRLSGLTDSVVRRFFSVLATNVYTKRHDIRFSRPRYNFSLASMSE